ncbi:MAG TPA: PDP protein [Campylobacterales bacterium]|nr:PDP protein [Campylobacterales bacterium]
MKKLFILPVCFGVLFGAPKQQYLSVDECNKIFEQRKSELALQIERLEEKEQALNALQNANKNVSGQKEQKLNLKLNEINKALSDVAKKEQNIKNMLDENKKVLEAIEKSKDEKITQSYVKMKPSAAAGILSEMNASSAASILFNLEAKKMAEILGKMDAKKAAEAVGRLKKGPPF